MESILGSNYLEFILFGIIAILIIAILVVIFKILSVNTKNPAEDFRYQRKTCLLSPHELNFFKELAQIAHAKEYLVFAKVVLANIVDPRQDMTNPQATLQYVQDKCVDFLLCDRQLRPILAVALYEKNPQQPDRMDRDPVVDRVLQDANIPILHTFNGQQLEENINRSLGLPTIPQENAQNA